MLKILRMFPQIIITIISLASSARYSNRTFIYVNSPMTVSNAQKHCKTTYNTSLATITNQEENDYITSVCDPSASGCSSSWSGWYKCGCTIGLNDITTEDTFKWFDGSSWDDSKDFNNFDGSEPNDFAGEDCVGVWKNVPDWARGFFNLGDDGTWHDQDCDAPKTFFCNDYENCMVDPDDCDNINPIVNDGWRYQKCGQGGNCEKHISCNVNSAGGHVVSGPSGLVWNDIIKTFDRDSVTCTLDNGLCAEWEGSGIYYGNTGVADVCNEICPPGISFCDDYCQCI